MLTDRNPGPQQLRVRGPGWVCGVVDVQRIDADEQRPLPDQELASFGGEVRVFAEVLGRAPVAGEVGPNQYGSIADLDLADRIRADRALVARAVDDYSLQVR